MRGLLEKDFRLVRGQARTAAYMIAIGLAVVYFSGNYQFLLFYFAAFGVKFATETVGYDESDNGYPCLFALPISRRGYVWEKYFFGILVEMGTCVLALLLSGATWASGLTAAPAAVSDVVTEFLLAMQMGAVVLAVSMPIYLRFEAEKRRTVLMLLYLVLVALVAVLFWLLSRAEADPAALTLRFAGLPPVLAAVGGLLFFLLFIGASLKISCRIMERKEF